MEHPLSLQRQYRYAVIVKRAVLRTVFGKKVAERKQKLVKNDYEKWALTDRWLKKFVKRPRLGTIGGRLANFYRADFQKSNIKNISATIKRLRPETVLEAGSGNGFNLLALAIMRPEVKEWRGLELTQAGVRVAEHFRRNPPFEALQKITDFEKAIIAERLSKANIIFAEGNALKMPFQDKSVDFAFTHLVLEQIPYEYPKALAEIKRVIRHNACLIEPWREAQNFFQYLHLGNVDYFRGSIREAEKANLHIEQFKILPYAKIEFTPALLLCSA